MAGAPPAILHKGLVAQHSQTWKLREYHLTSVGATLATNPQNPFDEALDAPLGGGDPLKAYFPDGTQIFDRGHAIEVREPGRTKSLFYNRAQTVDIASTLAIKDEDYQEPQVNDVIIIGEVRHSSSENSQEPDICGKGHSAWGEFNLLGRVRPCDGFVSLCKTYVRCRNSSKA